jgi:hypothetical protein
MDADHDPENVASRQSPVPDKVIAIGDPLFGSTVTGFLLDPEGLNDAGQVAFLAQLADGRIAIARADPTEVPEPMPLSLRLLGVAGLIVTKNRMSQPGCHSSS